MINRSTDIATLRAMLIANPIDMSSPFTNLSGAVIFEHCCVGIRKCDVLSSTGTTLYGFWAAGCFCSELLAFDISGSEVAYLAINGTSSVTLHAVNPATGVATSVGEIWRR